MILKIKEVNFFKPLCQNFVERDEENFMIILDQWSHFHLGFNAKAEIQTLNLTFSVFKLRFASISLAGV